MTPDAGFLGPSLMGWYVRRFVFVADERGPKTTLLLQLHRKDVRLCMRSLAAEMSAVFIIQLEDAVCDFSYLC